jgi:hypothetical protein
MIDSKSETWETLEAWIDKELAAISRKLTSKASDQDDTQYNRGLYAALEAIKNLPAKVEIKPLEIDSYFN